MRLLLLSLLVAGGLNAQPGGVTGVTVDQAGAPLARVHIRLITGNFDAGEGVQKVYGADSDTTGRYSFDAIPPGLYLLWAERMGFLQKSEGPFSMLAVKPGQHLTGHKIVLTAQAVIAGRVTDEYGDPVQGVPVQTEVVSGQPDFMMFGRRNVVTDDRGEFRLIASPGKYLVMAGQMGGPQQASEVRTDGTAGGPLVTTYFPGTASKETASAIELAAGQSLGGIDIRLLRAGPTTAAHKFTVSGVVLGTPEKGRASISLRFGEKAGELLYNGNSTVTDPDGKFSISGMQPGYYSVAASYSAGKTQLQSHSVEFHLDADQTGLQLTLTPGEDLAGKLEFVGEAPAGTSEKHAVRLESTGWSHPFGQGAPPASEVSADGSFRINGVAPMKYKPVVDPMPENGYVKEVAVDGKAMPDRELDFSQGVGGARLKITVSRAGGQLSGRVLDKDGDAAVGLIMVVFATDAKHIDEEDTVRTSDGKYSFKGIRPGKYRLVAVDLAEMMQAFSGDGQAENTMQRLFDAGEEIEIKDGDRITKDLPALTKVPEKKKER